MNQTATTIVGITVFGIIHTNIITIIINIPLESLSFFQICSVLLLLLFILAWRYWQLCSVLVLLLLLLL